jgi:hypothetical protein
LSEPGIDRREKLARLLPLALIGPEPRKFSSGAKLPKLPLLSESNVYSSLVLRACPFRRIQRAEYVATTASNIAFIRAFAVPLNPGQGFVGAVERRTRLPARELVFGLNREGERQPAIHADLAAGLNPRRDRDVLGKVVLVRHLARLLCEPAARPRLSTKMATHSAKHESVAHA